MLIRSILAQVNSFCYGFIGGRTMNWRLVAASFMTVLALSGMTQAAVVTIYAEDFSAGIADATWDDTDSTPTTVEDWTGTGGASARGLATTYDHDQNGGTANINIPGGLEVMDATIAVPGTTTAFTSFALPTNLNVNVAGEIALFAMNRLTSGSGGQDPRIELFNVTDSRSILSSTPISYSNSTWTFNAFAINFIAADQGDTVELRLSETIFSGANSGARGLEVADIQFTAALTPEPSSMMLMLFGVVGIALGCVRCRRR